MLLLIEWLPSVNRLKLVIRMRVVRPDFSPQQTDVHQDFLSCPSECVCHEDNVALSVLFNDQLRKLAEFLHFGVSGPASYWHLQSKYC